MPARRRLVHQTHLYQSLGIIMLSVLIAILIAQSSALETVLLRVSETQLLGSFLAGMLFTSVFTAAPATVLLGELAQIHSLWLVAVSGALGAVIGNYLIFRFVRDRLAEDIRFLFKRKRGWWIKLFRFSATRFLLTILGVVVIASPLPDELGVALLGLNRTKIRLFFLLSLLANFVGIVLIGITAQQLG